MDKWSDIEIVRFLDLFEMRPCLWNPDLDEYRSPDKRSEAIRWIIEKMGVRMSEMEIRCKIKNIRTTYVRYLKRILRARHLGLGEKYTPTLVWFKRADVFLRTHSERTLLKKAQKRNLESAKTSKQSNSSTTSIYASDSETETAAVETEGEDDDDINSPDATQASSHSGEPSKNPEQKKSDAVDTLKSDGDSAHQSKSQNNSMPRHSKNQPIPSLLQRNLELRNKKRQISDANLGDHHGSSSGHSGAHNADARSKRKRRKISNRAEDQEDDDFKIFSKLVANHLRKLPLDRGLRCQDEIHSLLVKERIEYCQQLTKSVKPVVSGIVEPSQEVVEIAPDQNRVVTEEESLSFAMDCASGTTEPAQEVVEITSTDQNQLIKEESLGIDGDSLDD